MPFVYSWTLEHRLGKAQLIGPIAKASHPEKVIEKGKISDATKHPAAREKQPHC